MWKICTAVHSKPICNIKRNRRNITMGITKLVGGGADYKLTMYQENDRAVFYVRPFSAELKKDLNRLIVDTGKVSKTTHITERNGTYRIASEEKLEGIDFYQSFWGMLFRRFLAESKYVCVDPVTCEKYYEVIISNQYIEPCERRLAV